MITVDVKNEREVVIFLDKSQKAVVAAASRGVHKATIMLANYIKEEELSGQVLQNRTGNLRRSITPDVSTPLSGRVFIGEEGWYGKVHEFGKVIEPVNAKVLHFVVDGHDVFAHRVTIPERSFMRKGLADMRQRIVDTINAEIHHVTPDEVSSE